MLRYPTENCIQRAEDGSGAYQFKICGQLLNVIASHGLGWDHVSVSHRKRCPTWHEMCRIKDLFFDEKDTVIQIHPPKSVYVNDHPRCLHLWRKQNTKTELPPIETV